MASEWRKYYAEKRGSSQVCSLEFDENVFVQPPQEKVGVESSEALFDRQWALTVLEQSLLVLQEDYVRRDQQLRFSVLKIYLEWQDEGHSPDGYAEVASRLNMTEGAVKVAVFRLRKQYREILIDKVKQTLDEGSEAEVEEELIYLLRALGDA